MRDKALRGTIFRYTVRAGGIGGDFPIDMLRYDSAYPDSELDAGEILATFEARSRRRADRGIRLVGLRRPTVARWESFGWSVDRDVQAVNL